MFQFPLISDPIVMSIYENWIMSSLFMFIVALRCVIGESPPLFPWKARDTYKKLENLSSGAHVINFNLAPRKTYDWNLAYIFVYSLFLQ